MMTAARQFPGHRGGYLVPPAPDCVADAGLYHVLFAFDTEAHLADWQRSTERARWLAEMAPHTEADGGYRRVPGLEYWFADPGRARAAPPRWKFAMVTWLGISPTVWVTQQLLAEPLAGWHSFPRVMFVTALVAALMTWWIAPLLTRLFSGWLFRSGA